MRILIVSPVIPYPPAWGFATRVYQFLNLLARNNSVSLLAYAGPGDIEHVSALTRMCTAVHTVVRAKPTTGDKRWAQLSAMLSPVSYQRRSLLSGEMQQKLDELTAREPYDVIQVETSHLANFDFDPRAILVLAEHDIVYELLHRMYQTESSVIRRAYNWTEFVKFRRDEIRSWRSAGGVVTTSMRERRIIQGLAPDTPVLDAPNGVDLDYFHPSSEPVDDNAIVMTGFMKTRPNIDAALHFVEEVLPHIVAARPKMVFYVVGGDPPDEIRRLAGPNVAVTDTVPDVRPYVYRSAVFVVPLRMGGGTRLKVLEALSMKKPLVSTSLGCEGIDVKHREHLLIADEPVAFANAVLELLDDRALAARLAHQGHGLVERQYQWKTVVDSVEAFYRELLEARSGKASR
jgi:polysaccharide biosynthesis protein PslH